MPSKRVMLIVDNVDEKSKYLETIFKDDFTIFCAFSDSEAISIIEKEKLSIIMLNVLRPNLNGYVVLDYLKNSVYVDLPVVSICSDETEQVKLLKYGVDEFIVKGINPDIIKIRVDHILTRFNLQKERKLVEELKLYNNLVNESSNAVYVVDYNTYEILHMNTTMLRLINKEGDDFHNKKCYEFLLGAKSPCKECNCKNLNYKTYTSKNFKNTLTNNSYCVRGKYINWDGHFAHVEYIQDITDTVNANEENIKLKRQAETALEKYQTIVNTVPGAIVLYEVVNNTVKTKYYSDGLCTLTGFTREERDAYNGEDAMSLVWKEDADKLRKTYIEAIKHKKDIDITYRIRPKSGKPRFVNLRATYLSTNTTNPEFHAVLTDVDEMKKLEESLLEQQLRYKVAVKSAGMNIWEYDIENDTLIVGSSSSRIKKSCFKIDDYIKSYVNNEFIREDSRETFYNIYKELKEGKGEVTGDVWFKSLNVNEYWCERITYTTVFDERGKPLKAFGAGRDITREKNAEAKFQEEVKYREVVQRQKLAYFKLNLTQNTILEAECKTKSLEDIIKSLTVDEYFKKTLSCLTDKAQVSVFKKKFNRNALVYSYNGSEYSFSYDLTVQYDNSPIYWVDYSVHLMKNAESKDLIAYIIATNKTDEKVLQTVMETVAKTDYDFFVVVNGQMNSALDYTFKSDLHLFDSAQPFEKRLQELVFKDVCKEDLERVLSICKIDKIIEQIKDGKVLKLNFSVVNEKGALRRKQLQFTLISLQVKAFLMTQIDVNDIYLEQQKVQEQLRTALDAATKANLVKTDFLSRMSHDMRTPMNGIIGLTKLSLDLPGLSKELISNLKSIDDSSKFLLSLINDTLDMNKIESNKITLHQECFNPEEMLANIIAAVSPLIQEKQITLEYLPINIELNYIKADKMRLEQVILNILSNSIKFTPHNGKIIIEVKVLKKEKNMSFISLTISDNGRGMSKEFLPTAFEPFTQESSKIDPMYVGTGLGLPIAKKLITLMDGTIEMESELGKGTKTTIHLKLEEQEMCEQSANTTTHTDYTFLKGRHILLCEDHPLNSQIAKKLLEKKKMVVTTAFNGQEAFDIFSKSQPYTFDLILMDIRMPVLNGLEATKAIRALKREDAKSIPIVAMTANAFDDDVEKSKEVGMTAHLAKPVEPELLYLTILRLIL